MSGFVLVCGFGHELILFDFFYFMSGMAVFTSRELFVLISPGYAVDALCVYIVNSFMAGCAGRCDVFKVNGRPCVIMFEFEMGGVTVRANGAGQEPFFDQALSMHTAGVVDLRVSGSGFYDGGLT